MKVQMVFYRSCFKRFSNHFKTVSTSDMEKTMSDVEKIISDIIKTTSDLFSHLANRCGTDFYKEFVL